MPNLSGLFFDTPVSTWDEALPLGNGMLGSLVWGDGNPLRISLDRADLWDLRPIPEFQGENYSFAQLAKWRREGNFTEITRLYDEPYSNNPAPTKLPAGRIELDFREKSLFVSSSLNIEDAVANVRLQNMELQAFVHATDAVGVIRGEGTCPKIKLLAPAFQGEGMNGALAGGDYGDLTTLQYPAPIETSGENWCAFNQQGYAGFQFAVFIKWHQNDNGWLAAYSIASTNEGDQPLRIARDRVESALSSGYEALFETHKAWWNSYWKQSSIEIPDVLLRKGWYLEQYKFGAAARRGAPPIPLQGPWTADDGKLPPWKGDLHHDMNSQMCYWPCYSANHLEEGLGFIDWLWQTRPNCLKWTKNFYGVEGLNVPGVTDLAGSPLGGWPQYAFSCTTSAWLAQHFYWHWRYSRDEEFLRERAYPYLTDVAVFIEAMTNERDTDGFRTLDLSSTPEINNNQLDAWFPSFTNHDLSLIRWLFGAIMELADEMALYSQAEYWRSVLAQFPDLAFGKDDTLLVAKGIELNESQRHHAHLMALYPLKLIDPYSSPEAMGIYDASLTQLEKLGTQYWCGFSFSWLAILLAQAGNGEKAAATLHTFYNAFTLRNGFHCNGDQSGQGFSSFTYRPFTLEGNFAAAVALQDMLLQCHGDRLHIFPAIPESWASASFNTLRADGAWLVSARRESGQTVWLRIEAEKGGTCHLSSPFSGQPISLTLDKAQYIELTQDPI